MAKLPERPSSRALTRREGETIEPGTVVLRDGAPIQEVLMVERGSLVVTAGGRTEVGAGDIVGGLDLLETGTAKGKVVAGEQGATVRRLDRTAFLDALERDGRLALAVLKPLVARARARPEANTGTALIATEGKTSGAGLLGGLLSRLGLRRRGEDTAPQAAAPGNEVVALVPPVPGDPDNAVQWALLETLNSLPGMVAKPWEGTPPAAALGDEDLDATTARLRAGTVAREALTEEGADLMVWATLESDQRVADIRVTAASVPDESRGSVLAPELRVVLGLPLNDAADRALVCLAALTGLDDMGAEALEPVRGLIGTLVDMLPDGGPPLAKVLTGVEQGITLTTLGQALALAARVEPGGTRGVQAQAAYDKALKRLPRDDDRGHGTLHRLMGLLQQSLGEATGDGAAFTAAVEHYKTALGTVTKADAPRDWAALNVRLGQCAHRAGLKTGDDGMLRDSLQAYQDASSVYTKASAPMKWADLMNSMASVLQVFGDQMRNGEAIERAVGLCDMALEVRTREKAPMLWAATQNNKGSALFLLARNGGGDSHAEAAEQAFQAALEVYKSQGADRLARVTERNLARLHAHARTQTGKTKADPNWAGG